MLKPGTAPAKAIAGHLLSPRGPMDRGSRFMVSMKRHAVPAGSDTAHRLRLTDASSSRFRMSLSKSRRTQSA